MRENYFITQSIRKASSLKSFSIRAKMNDCLHDDVEYFLSRTQPNISRLVDKLLSNDFALARYADPEYPAKRKK